MRVILLFSFILSLLSSCKEEPPRYNGYIDADLVYLSSSFPGRLAHLSVMRGARVRQEQLLFKVDEQDSDFVIAMNQLKKKELLAQQEELRHQIKYEQLNTQRILRMRAKDAASQNDLDQAHTHLAVLRDQLAAIHWQIKNQDVAIQEKKWQRSQQEGYATEEGIIFDSYFLRDEYVQAGQPIVSLVTPQHIKVIFFVAEPDLNHIALDQQVNVFVGDELIAKATINYVSSIAQYTPPIIYSRENNHNLVFRVEGHIEHPDVTRLHLGQPIRLEPIA